MQDTQIRKVYRVLGKKGRTTIPYAIRKKLGITYNDLLSFEEGEDGKTVIIKKEKVCNGCKDKQPKEEVTLFEFLNSLTPKQQKAALVHLSVKCTEEKGVWYER